MDHWFIWLGALSLRDAVDSELDGLLARTELENAVFAAAERISAGTSRKGV